MVISNLIALEIRKKHVSTYTVLQSAVIELVPLCNDQQTIPAVITQWLNLPLLKRRILTFNLSLIT